MKRHESIKTAKACPFCGNKDLLLWDNEDGEKDFEPMAYWVECLECCAEGPYSPTDIGALALWNKRGRK